MIGHSSTGLGYDYPDGEFLCIVSKNNDRGSREDACNPVTERVKVREKARRKIKDK